MHAIATGPQLPSTSKTSEPGQVLGLLRIAGSLHARVEEALAAVDLSYREYRALESLEVDASADAGGWGRVAVTRTQTLAALVARGLVSPVGEARGSGRTALTSLGSGRLRVARARVRSVARAFAAAVGDTEASALVGLLERVDGRRSGGSGDGAPGRA